MNIIKAILMWVRYHDLRKMKFKRLKQLAQFQEFVSQHEKDKMLLKKIQCTFDTLVEKLDSETILAIPNHFPKCFEIKDSTPHQRIPSRKKFKIAFKK